ncbi:MAG TPA: adenylate/guanylate cyclase domain-containing protein [Kofleriaceae bacterium]|nr:adenylate/guanylate cyclase domain-containing protein [Kofleriaceae bacterium]
MLLGTVRRKLTALVAFSALAALVVVPILSWLMHRQLIDEVDDRVPAAIAGFEQELSDDLRDLDVTARQLVKWADGDRPQFIKQAESFREAYPDLDVVLYDASGALVASSGCDQPQAHLPAIAVDQHVLLPHGCEASPTAPPAIAIVHRTAGMVVLVCLPLDANYFDNARAKLGLELAMRAGEQLLHATPRFPKYHIAEATRDGVIAERKTGGTWAVASFVPPSLPPQVQGQPQLEFYSALDVTDIKDIVRRHLLIAIAILGAVTIASVTLGWRLASRMSRALARVNHAVKRLEQQEYVKVDVVKTGDELEDLATGFNAMVDGLQERDKLRSTMGKYMTEELVKHVLAGAVELGGKTLEVTILFCDLRDFTSLSEKRSAHEIVEILNEYFTEMVDCVMGEGGVVDKYIGDNIMAVFGAPVSRGDDAARAVRAAVHMREALAKLNARFEQLGRPKLRFGIGLHTGEVVAGNIGSAKRMEYTVIGDAVNLASRLESKTKELGTDLLISDATYEKAKGVIDGEAAGEIKVKGREQAVQIYKVVGIKAQRKTSSSDAA